MAPSAPACPVSLARLNVGQVVQPEREPRQRAMSRSSECEAEVCEASRAVCFVRVTCRTQEPAWSLRPPSACSSCRLRPHSLLNMERLAEKDGSSRREIDSRNTMGVSITPLGLQEKAAGVTNEPRTQAE